MHRCRCFRHACAWGGGNMLERQIRLRCAMPPLVAMAGWHAVGPTHRAHHQRPAHPSMHARTHASLWKDPRAWTPEGLFLAVKMFAPFACIAQVLLSALKMDFWLPAWCRFPYYYHAKFAFLLWLQLPKTQVRSRRR